MKSIVITLNVPEDTDIFEIHSVVEEAVEGNGWDVEDADISVFESEQAYEQDRREARA